MKRLAILAIIVCAWFHLAPAHAQFNGCSSFCGTSSSAIADAPGFNNFQGSGSGPALACTYTPVTSGNQNVAYTGATPSASGGTPAYTFSETGALPTGLSINTSTGVISGTPSVNGSFAGIQVKVADTVPTTVNCGASFTLVIAAGSCTASSNFFARTSGLSATEHNAYDTMICGLVTDGVITGDLSGAAGCGTVLDGLYIFATNTTTTANLNLCGTNFGITVSAAPTFSADHGYTGNGSTQFLNTNFNPSTAGGVTTLNSASLGVYTLTNRGSDSNQIAMGAADATGFTYLELFGGTANFLAEANGFTFGSGVTISASQGFSTVSRTVLSSIDQYKNASSTSLGTTTDPSTNLPNANYFVGGYSNAGTLTKPTSDQIAATFFGKGVTGAQHLLLSNRINAYMTALGINVY